LAVIILDTRDIAVSKINKKTLNPPEGKIINKLASKLSGVLDVDRCYGDKSEKKEREYGMGGGRWRW